MTTYSAIDGTDRQRSSALDSWPQRLVHVLAVLAGWAIFFWGWHKVLGQPLDNPTLRWLIIGSVVVLPTFTIAWVLHNVGIHRRKGPRRGSAAITHTYAVDWKGRPVRADWAALGSAQLVVIYVEGENKVYLMSGAPSVPRLAAAQSHQRATRSVPRSAAAQSHQRATRSAPEERTTETAELSEA